MSDYIPAPAEFIQLAQTEKVKLIERLAMEPEPDCFIETTGEATAFFQTLLAAPAIRRHVGVRAAGIPGLPVNCLQVVFSPDTKQECQR